MLMIGNVPVELNASEMDAISDCLTRAEEIVKTSDDPYRILPPKKLRINSKDCLSYLNQIREKVFSNTCEELTHMEGILFYWVLKNFETALRKKGTAMLKDLPRLFQRYRKMGGDHLDQSG
jgi:hypothetical protein